MATTDSIAALHKSISSMVTDGELSMPKDRRTQELVIALIGPVASGRTKANEILAQTLEI